MTLDAIIIFGSFLVLLFAGMWIPFAIAASAVLYIFWVGGWSGLKAIGLTSWGSLDSFTLTAIPLFILMAQLLLESGLSARVYRGMSHLVQRLPGGLLQTNIAGCGVFAAICGSSVACAAAIGTVALPQLDARGYDRRLSAGSLAAGGTLGILIPPSIAMIIYGSFTETSIAKLFMAGVIPGIVLMLLFMVYIGIRSFGVTPTPVGTGVADNEAGSLAEAFADLLPFTVLISIVIGSMYLGYATPTEAAAVGCVAAVLASIIWANLTLEHVWVSLVKTARASGGILFIVYAALLFSYAISISGVPEALAKVLLGFKLSRLEFLLGVFVVYIILGCVVDSLGMIVITVPLLHPVLTGYGVDPVWFGIVLVVLIELGQITPPFGINLFVVQGISKYPLSDVVRGSLPFCWIMLGMVALLTIWPELATWLPDHMSVRR